MDFKIVTLQQAMIYNTLHFKALFVFGNKTIRLDKTSVGDISSRGFFPYCNFLSLKTNEAVLKNVWMLTNIRGEAWHGNRS